MFALIYITTTSSVNPGCQAGRMPRLLPTHLHAQQAAAGARLEHYQERRFWQRCRFAEFPVLRPSASVVPFQTWVTISPDALLNKTSKTPAKYQSNPAPP